jgi:FAD/FMN-containing dehydrogenase
MTQPIDRKKFLTLGALALLSGNRIAKGALGSAPGTVAPPKNILRPGSPEYERLRAGYNLRIDRRPRAIAPCATAAEVSAAVRYASDQNLPVAVKSGGHSFEGFSSNDDGLVVNLAAMNAVEWLDDTTVRVGPACRLDALYDAILPRGRIIPGGSCGGVGIGGLSLGGGYGLFSRQFGLTCDSLMEVTMVDGSGKVRSSRDDADLLRACRGGGNGHFGVVTAMTFRTHAAPEMLRSHRFKAGKLDTARATELLKRWFEIVATLPDTAFSAFVLNGPYLTILVTDTADTAGATDAALAKLKAITDRQPKPGIAPLATGIRNYYGRSQPLWFKNASAGMLRGYADIAAATPAAFAKVVATPGMIWQCNTLGGQITRANSAESCFPHRAKPFLAELQAYPIKDADRPLLLKRFAEVQAIFREAGVRDHYANYPDLAFKDWETAYYGDTAAFLRRMKRRYDPENRIRHPQSLVAG